jgi:hypothetical protein
MAVIVVTAANVRPIYQEANLAKRTARASVAITAGQLLYLTATGTLALTNGGAAGTAQFCGVALNGGAIGDVIEYLPEGECAGFTIPQNVGVAVFVSDTPGALDDATGTITAPIGRVRGITDAGGTVTKVIRFQAQYGALFA